MKIEINDIDGELPYNLGDTVYLLHNAQEATGVLLKLNVLFERNTGHPNIRLKITADIRVGNQTVTKDFGCFSSKQEFAGRSDRKRMVRLARASGLSIFNHLGMNRKPIDPS